MARKHSTAVPAGLAARPLRTFRTGQAEDTYAHPGPEIARLHEHGLLHRLADGYYVVVPQDMLGRTWIPDLEAAAAGIATTIYDHDDIVVMGLSAARLHGAIPRALATAIVAVPRQHRPITLTDRPAVVRFVKRNTAELDAERVRTELGPTLVTTPEQTSPRPGAPPHPRRQRKPTSPPLSRPFTHAADPDRLQPASPPNSVGWPPCAAPRNGRESIMDPDERDSVATQFGVSTEQVERDHLISHLLAFLSRDFGDRIHFIGGTALARTHLPDGRLSEDIDLIAVGSRKDVARDLDAALPRAVARTHGRLTVEPALSATADTLPVLLRPADGRPVRLQLLSARDRVVWPTERRGLFQRYGPTNKAPTQRMSDRARRHLLAAPTTQARPRLRSRN